LNSPFMVVFVSLRSVQNQGPPDLVDRFATVGARHPLFHVLFTLFSMYGRIFT